MIAYILVALGSALGGMARYGLVLAVGRLTGPAFPWGTILVNISGSFVIAFAATLTAAGGRFAAPMEVRTFIMVGLCGGYTTFSSFSLQTLDLLRAGRPGEALGNIVLSVVLCVAGAALGYYVAAAINPALIGGR